MWPTVIWVNDMSPYTETCVGADKKRVPAGQ